MKKAELGLSTEEDQTSESYEDSSSSAEDHGPVFEYIPRFMTMDQFRKMKFRELQNKFILEKNEEKRRLEALKEPVVRLSVIERDFIDGEAV